MPNTNGTFKWIAGSLLTICTVLAGLGYDSFQADINEIQRAKDMNSTAIIQIQLDLADIKAGIRSNARERKTTDSLILISLSKIEKKEGDL